MKQIAITCFLFFALIANAQNNRAIPVKSVPLNKQFERSAKYPALSPAKYKSRQSSSRSENISFYMDYGLMDSFYNVYGPNNGGGTWYQDDQYAFRLINSGLPVDSVDYMKYGFTWFPRIIDFVNNPNWPFNEYPPSKIQMTIDTVYVTLGHVHLSNLNDTITVSVWDFDSFQEFTFDSGVAGGGTTLLGQIEVIVDSSILGGDGQGTTPGTFQLGTYPFSFAGNPVVVPQGHRFIVQLNFNGPYQDEFLLSSTRRNDCASTCGASIPYVNATFGSVSSDLDSFNSCYGVRYATPPDSGIFPSPYFYVDCNSDGMKDGGCEELYTQDFDIFPNISATISQFFVTAEADQTAPCPNSNINLTANGAGSSATPYTYTWVVSSGSLSNSTGQQTTLTTSNIAVNDTVIVTLYDANNQSISDTLVITSGGINVRISNSVQPVEISCGQNAVLTTQISGYILGKSYNWSNGTAGIAASTLTVGTAGTYTVTVTNSNSCSASASVQVDYSGVQNAISFEQPAQIGEHQYAGCTLLFTNTSTYYQAPWIATLDALGNGSDDVTVYNGDPAIPYTYAIPGVYQVTLTMDSGGCSFSRTQTVEITSIPNGGTCSPLNSLFATLGNSETVCNGNSITLNPVITGGVQPFSYSWSNTGSPLSCYNCAYPVAAVTQNSAYTVTITDATASTATASVNINVSGSTSTMSISVSNTNISCASAVDTTTVTVSNGSAPYNYAWGDNNTSSGASPSTHLYTNAQVYIISVTDANGCIASVADTVNNNGVKVSLVRQVNVSCTSLGTGKIIVTGSGGTQPYRYSWNTGANTDSVTNLRTGYYTVTITDLNSCSGAATYYVGATDWDFYVYLNTTNANCSNNGSINASIYGGYPPYIYDWSNFDTSTTIAGLPGGAYSLMVQDSLGCQTTGSAFISQSCNSVISGTVYTDINANCVLDNNEPGVSSVYVEVYNSNQSVYNYAVTDSEGHYSVTVPYAGSYTIQYYDYLGCQFASSCSSTINITIANLGDSSANNNFGLNNNSGGFDLGIHPGWTSADPGFQKEYWAFYYNSSYTAFNGVATITFNYDSNLLYEYSVPPATYNPVNHTLTWTVNPVSSWGPQVVSYFQVPASLSPTYLLQSDFTILPIAGDCNPSDNHYHYSENVYSSHDPNEKDVSPATYVDNDSTLTYTIHFQNNGTDSTNFITVVDTLSSELNPATVQTIASSSPNYQFNITGAGILTWVFNPYRLVDSITNPGGSKGFVMFTVQPRSNRATGAVISNRASIYFDYNSGVMTNAVTDTVTTATGIPSISLNGKPEITVFPNPASTVLYITSNFTAKWLTIFDINGREISEQKFVAALDISQLTAGIYFIEVKNESVTVRTKVVKLTGQ